MLNDLNTIKLDEELPNELGQTMHKCIEHGVTVKGILIGVERERRGREKANER